MNPTPPPPPPPPMPAGFGSSVHQPFAGSDGVFRQSTSSGYSFPWADSSSEDINN